MPAPSETLLILEQRLVERLLAFERLDEAWPRGRTAVERAEIGRQREEALYEIITLRQVQKYEKGTNRILASRPPCSH